MYTHCPVLSFVHTLSCFKFCINFIQFDVLYKHKESLLHLFLECTYSKKKLVFISKCFLKIVVLTCSIYMHLIILGKMNPLDPDNTNNQVILILKFYLYKCRCLVDKPSINGGLKYLKYCIKIEKTTINFLSPIVLI